MDAAEQSVQSIVETAAIPQDPADGRQGDGLRDRPLLDQAVKGVGADPAVSGGLLAGQQARPSRDVGLGGHRKSIFGTMTDGLNVTR